MRSHVSAAACSSACSAAESNVAIPNTTSCHASVRALAWHDVVFGIATFDSAAEHALLQAAADTWLRMAEGADLLITTDGDDPRPDDQAPQYI